MAKEKKVKKLKLEDYKEQFVPAYPTENNVYHPKNKTVMLHPDIAAHLETKGLVTLEQPEDWEEDDSETIDGITQKGGEE